MFFSNISSTIHILYQQALSYSALLGWLNFNNEKEPMIDRFWTHLRPRKVKEQLIFIIFGNSERSFFLLFLEIAKEVSYYFWK